MKGLWGSKKKVIVGKKQQEVLVDDAYLRESIVNPAAKIVVGYDNTMPSYTDFTKEQLDSMIEYMQSLSGEEEKTESTSAPAAEKPKE